ncbi:MAG: PEGA domain-containing protein [Opitutaceae bacterium]|jgi:hypothetical protein|nr:PEGA domain-containing protein [Opitutaceae bacterium]
MNRHFASRTRTRACARPSRRIFSAIALPAFVLLALPLACPAQTPAAAGNAPPPPASASRGGVNIHGPGGGRSSVTTTRTVETGPAQTETRTFVRDGKTVTETVTRVTSSEAVSESKIYRAAIFAANRAGKKYDGKTAVFADFVAARAADIGVQTIARETAVDATRKFDPETASSPRPENSLDTQLTNQSSALRLAQNLGADYILQVSIGSVTRTVRNIKAYGVELANAEYGLLASYSILDGATGAALTGATVRATRVEQQNAHASAELEDAGILDGLLDDAAGQIADGLATRIAANRIPLPAAAQLVSIEIVPDVADMFLPDIRLDGSHTVSLSEGKNKVSVLNVTVEVDGVAVGSAPGKIQVRPGFSKLRLTREGFKPWERIISAADGQVLVVPMQMTDAGVSRWRELTKFVSDLRNGEKLTEAQAKVLEGEAQKLRQSGYKVDVKADAKELPAVQQKSLF